MEQYAHSSARHCDNGQIHLNSVLPKTTNHPPLVTNADRSLEHRRNSGQEHLKTQRTVASCYCVPPSLEDFWRILLQASERTWAQDRRHRASCGSSLRVSVCSSCKNPPSSCSLAEAQRELKHPLEGKELARFRDPISGEGLSDVKSIKVFRTVKPLRAGGASVQNEVSCA